MIAVYARCKVPGHNQEKFINIAKQLVAETIKEKGNISYELIRDTGDPAVFAFMERWESQEILDAHMKTPHFTALFPAMGELLDGEMQGTVFEIIA